MKFLYIIYSLVMDITPDNPIPHPKPFTLSSLIPIQDMIPVRLVIKGVDERFPIYQEGNNTEDELMKIIMMHYKFEQIQELQKLSTTNLEEVKKNYIINEVLKTDEIGQFNMKSGGLFDDWEIDI